MWTYLGQFEILNLRQFRQDNCDEHNNNNKNKINMNVQDKIVIVTGG